MTKKEARSTATSSPATMSARKLLVTPSPVDGESPTPATRRGPGRLRKGTIFSPSAENQSPGIGSSDTSSPEGLHTPVDSQDKRIVRFGAAHTARDRANDSSFTSTAPGGSHATALESSEASSEINPESPSSFDSRRRAIQTTWPSPDPKRVRQIAERANSEMQHLNSPIANTQSSRTLSGAVVPVAVANLNAPPSGALSGAVVPVPIANSNVMTNGILPSTVRPASLTTSLYQGLCKAFYEAPQNPLVPIALVLCFLAFLFILWVGTWAIVWPWFTFLNMLGFRFPQRVLRVLGDSLLELGCAYYSGSCKVFSPGHDQFSPKMQPNKNTAKGSSWSWFS
ncbi:uncharacterized protein BDZ99DRAFT_576839 [Mytilinidion resinicola]|uniref:Uncharacterized protein n=1 Tax=Mytilinidion resinicola TaxID=574789 RepID=A0A6A6Y0X8_9PEZI|nr:uncharacterized protein BDZ99DRAFT_576839 [Mytilinidion resinicola]KAF2802466.1 hypothetical protein BDZ99DRAFT_576839 [Mytilinidion resinicola]